MAHIQAEKGEAARLRDALRRLAKRRKKKWFFMLDALTDQVHIHEGRR
jgi:hypothetical protein